MNKQMPVALVTGVGPGTGAAIARRFSQGGYALAMLARNGERLGVLEREIGNSHAYRCDVTDEAQLDRAIEAIRTDLGAPSVLIHNAVGGAFGNFMEIEPEVLNRNFQVNTMALLYLARRLAPAMIEAGRGAIVASGNTSALAWQGELRRLRADQGRAKDTRGIDGTGARTKRHPRRIRVDRRGHGSRVDAQALARRGR